VQEIRTMPKRPAKPAASSSFRSKPLLPHVDDSYKSRGKREDPTVCPDCTAVFTQGRWQWLTAPAAAHRERCPACHRIHDNAAAGYVTLEGEFLAEHRDEILALVRNVEQKERAQRPLQRIMAVSDARDHILVTTTGSHLARNIGEAIRHAYQGDLELNYNEGENLARVRWKR